MKWEYKCLEIFLLYLVKSKLKKEQLAVTTYKNNTGKLGIGTYYQFVNFGCETESKSGSTRTILI